jgi:hypothetical protein
MLSPVSLTEGKVIHENPEVNLLRHWPFNKKVFGNRAHPNNLRAGVSHIKEIPTFIQSRKL